VIKKTLKTLIEDFILIIKNKIMVKIIYVNKNPAPFSKFILAKTILYLKSYLSKGQYFKNNSFLLMVK